MEPLFLSCPLCGERMETPVIITEVYGNSKECKDLKQGDTVDKKALLKLFDGNLLRLKSAYSWMPNPSIKEALEDDACTEIAEGTPINKLDKSGYADVKAALLGCILAKGGLGDRFYERARKLAAQEQKEVLRETSFNKLKLLVAILVRATRFRPARTVAEQAYDEDVCNRMAECEHPEKKRRATGGAAVAGGEPKQFQIYVKNLDGATITLTVTPADNMALLKAMLYQKSKGIGLKPEQFRLICNGQQLEDGRTVSCYNIREKSTMHVVMYCRGGMHHDSSGRHFSFEWGQNWGWDSLGYNYRSDGIYVQLSVESDDKKRTTYVMPLDDRDSIETEAQLHMSILKIAILGLVQFPKDFILTYRTALELIIINPSGEGPSPFRLSLGLPSRRCDTNDGRPNAFHVDVTQRD